MHILTLTAPLTVGGSIGTLTPGDWVLHDQNAFELAIMAERGTALLMSYFPRVNPIGSTILFMRSGAIGDLLFLGPAIRAYKKANPNTPVHLCCRKEHWGLFKNTDLVSELIQYPPKLKNLAEYLRVVSLENVMELAPNTHATDIFAGALKVSVEDYKPIYQVTDEEKSIVSYLTRSTRPKLGVQMVSSTKNRNYPLELWAEVITELHDRGWEVFLFGLPGQIPTMPPDVRRPFIHDISDKGMTFRETAALLSLCNAFVGVDSSLLHLCHALDIPAVGLYGPFNWEARTGKAPLTRALSGEGECAGCHWHAKNGQHFPPMACREAQRCSVLASIPPDRIIAKIDAFR